MSTTAEINLAELFARVGKCLIFLGIDKGTEDTLEFITFLDYEGHESMLAGFGNYTRSIEERCEKVEKWIFERERQTKTCEHVGKIGERMDFRVRVIFTKTWETEQGVRSMTVAHDEDGNHILYWNTFNIATEDSRRAAQKGERVSFSAMVKDHNFREGVKQTIVQRATKAKLIP